MDNQNNPMRPGSSTPPPATPPVSMPQQTPPERPVMSPTTPPAPMQPLPTAFQQPPKKKRTGLIVGIVLGSIAVIGIITAVLLYFLWWQNPQKVVTDALVGAVTAQKSITSSTMTVKSDDFNIAVSMKGSADSPKSSFDTKVKMSSKHLGDFGEFELQLAGVMDEKGTIYLKADGLQKIMDKAVELAVEFTTSSYDSATPSPSEMAEVERQVRQMFEPIVKKIDGQWLKIAIDDFSETKEAKCMADALVEIQNDDSYMQEVGSIYRAHPFIVTKDTKVESRNGATGYEIDLLGGRDKAKDFANAMKDSKITKKLNECVEDTTSSDSEYDADVDNSEVDDALRDTQVRIWVSPFTHTLKEIEVTSKSNGVEAKGSYTFEIGKSNAIDIPSDARSAKEVFEEIQRDIEKVTGGGYTTLSTNTSTYDGGSI